MPDYLFIFEKFSVELGTDVWGKTSILFPPMITDAFNQILHFYSFAKMPPRLKANIFIILIAVNFVLCVLLELFYPL